MCKIFFCVLEGKAVERWISPVAACALFREPQLDFADYTCVLQHWLTHSIISPTVTWEIKRQKLDPYWLTFFGKKIWDCVASIRDNEWQVSVWVCWVFLPLILAKGLHTVSNFLFRYCLVYTWNLINWIFQISDQDYNGCVHCSVLTNMIMGIFL